MNDVIGIGPYVGSIEQEILTFRPYSLWIYNNIDTNKIYLSSHFNRRFLYDWIDDDFFLSIGKHYTRDEINQHGYIHKKINQKDFFLQIKRLKDYIHNRENINKKDIINYFLSYSESTPPYSIYNKIFTKINIPSIDISIKDRIVFIPSDTEDIKKNEKIYDFLVNKYNAIIIGDSKINFFECNEAAKHIDYLENNLIYILNYLKYAKCIICPSSFWTFLSNLQGWKVFSWGKINPYRDTGIYYFNNKRFDGIISDNETNMNIIKESIKKFIEKNI